jgi:hypothetical protein
MYLLHKTILAALALAATMTGMASSASALEVVTESTYVHCSAVISPTSGGCKIRMVSGTVELGAPFFMTNCSWTFEGRVGETGEGWIYDVVLSNCSPQHWVECRDASGADSPWPLELATGEEDGPYSPAETALETEFCTQAPFFISCHLELDVTEVSAHGYVAHTNNPVSHRSCENINYSTTSFSGQWQFVFDEAHPAIEIKH